MAGSLLAAVIVSLTIQPGMLGGLIQGAVWVMFSLLFVVLFTAIGLAWEHHKSSIEHARRARELAHVIVILTSSRPSWPRRTL